MNPQSSEFLHPMLARHNTRARGEFVGRFGERDRLKLFTRDAARGLGGAMSVEGPFGAGKSELLRQWLGDLCAQGGEFCPLFIDIHESAPRPSEAQPDPSSPHTLLLTVAGQALAVQGKLDWRTARPMDSEGVRMASQCYAAGLEDLAALLSPGAGWQPNPSGIRALIAALQGGGGGGRHPIWIFDGLGTQEETYRDGAGARRWLELIRELAGAGAAVVYEAPPGERRSVRTIEGICDRLELEPLAPHEALTLAEGLGRRRGWTLEAPIVQPVLARLGPWPGWVRAWAALVPPRLDEQPLRRAEEAYVTLLADSSWSERLQTAFEQRVPGSTRERALDLIHVARQRDNSIGLEEAVHVLRLEATTTEAILDDLEAVGLMTRRGVRWGAARTRALADWAWMAHEATHDPAGLEAARMHLLSELLQQPREEDELDRAPVDLETQLQQSLARFNSQLVPEVLFKYPDYFEAVGALDRGARRETALQARARLRLPEVLGVARCGGAGASGEPTIYLARAFRGGKYRRSNEEVWLIADLTATHAATTPEIRLALMAMRRVELRMGRGHYVRWIVMGNGASREAIELLAREQVFSSSVEQLYFIREVIEGAPDASPRPMVEPALPRAGAARIDYPGGALVQPSGKDPDSATRLDVPAVEGSEVTAARIAEKFASNAGFNESDIGKVRTAVLEGVLNAIEHSPNSEKRVYLEYLLYEDALEVRVENEGKPFDPLGVPEPDAYSKLTAVNKRGWGISLMRKFMDEVSYEPSARGTRLRLIKRRIGADLEAVHRLSAADASR